jgi:predicted acylesterase/phospholipase RssA
VLACDVSGLANWATAGGVSGGSIPALLIAAGVKPSANLQRAIATDYCQLFEQTRTFGQQLQQRFAARRSTRHRIREGILRSEGLGKTLEDVVPEWPEPFWTMAVAGRTQILFTARGIFAYRRGACTQLTEKPAPVGLAIRATCAVPGVIEAIELDRRFLGDCSSNEAKKFCGRVLFDGALSPYGWCPVGMLQAHFHAHSRDIVAIDLLDRSSRFERFATLSSHLMAHTLFQRAARRPLDSQIGVMIRTDMEVFDCLDFHVSLERKQLALLAAFQAAAHELFSKGEITNLDYQALLAYSQSWEHFQQLL